MKMKMTTISTIAAMIMVTPALAEIQFSGDATVGGVWNGSSTTFVSGMGLNISATTPDAPLTFGVDFSVDDTLSTTSSINAAFGDFRVSYGNIDGASDFRMGEVNTGGLGVNSYIANNAYGEDATQIRVDYDTNSFGMSVSANESFDQYGIGAQFSVGSVDLDMAVYSDNGLVGYALGSDITVWEIDLSATYGNFNGGAAEGVDLGAAYEISSNATVGAFYSRDIAANADAFGGWVDYSISSNATVVLSAANNGNVEFGVMLTF